MTEKDGRTETLTCIRGRDGRQKEGQKQQGRYGKMKEKDGKTETKRTTEILLQAKEPRTETLIKEDRNIEIRLAAE